MTDNAGLCSEPRVYVMFSHEGIFDYAQVAEAHGYRKETHTEANYVELRRR